MIELKEVQVNYRGKTVLNIPALKFAEGGRYGVIGENGSGKTTLLRLLAGTLRPNAGELSGVPSENVGYLPQAPFVFRMSVRHNVSMAMPRDVVNEKLVDKALERVGMSAMANARGDRLSGGEAQRVCLARVICLPRKLLLLDEPSSATDIRGMDQIEQMLLDYAQETGCTFIFSSHSPAQALRLAEQILYLEQGELVESGPAERVIHHPQDERTRSFLRHWQINGAGG